MKRYNHCYTLAQAREEEVREEEVNDEELGEEELRKDVSEVVQEEVEGVNYDEDKEKANVTNGGS
ncbi:hypothetical protein DEO72_LG10g1436 [Vigna unguiculata]|uniref:Uncharacterized protein n=1 Tax=Vigna unguiculata TaxID=3917 RepID=A0A4D6NCE8_VIGUN|nr:hypothetical protein DEO72_LG10g1436 [Vigna unguiculata]